MDLNDKDIYERVKAAAVKAAKDDRDVRNLIAELGSGYLDEARGAAIEYGCTGIDLSDHDNLIRMLNEIDKSISECA